MKPILSRATGASDEPEPTWEVAHLFPGQGMWSEEDYLALDGNRPVELARGFLEVLPMPTTSHQLLVLYLHGILAAFLRSGDLGTALVAPLRVRLWRRTFREPDVVFMRKENAHRMGEQFWTGADLVMEVVSPGPADRRRDLKTKRHEYAQAGIPEYWIIDPQEEKILVLRLAGKRYLTHGTFLHGTVASSHLLPGFTVEVSTAFSQQLPTATGQERQPRRKKGSAL